MAISRVKTWTSQEVVANGDLNGEFNNIINNARALISPLTGALDMDGNEFILDADADTSLISSTDDRLDVKMNGVSSLFRLDGTVASPVNGLNIIAGATGTRVVLDAGITGADANVGMTLLANGTGPIVIDNDTDPVDLRFLGAAGGYNSRLTDVNGNEVLELQGVASAVNQLAVLNAATGGAPALTARGETNVSLNLATSGTGVLQVNGSNVTGTNNRISAAGGGTAIDTSASTGFAQVSSGTWSVAALTFANLPSGRARVATTTYNLATASGTLAITHGGSTAPVAAFFLAARDLTDGTAIYISSGMTDGTNSGSLADGRTGVADSWSSESGNVMHIYTNGTADRVNFTLSALGTSTVDLTATKVGAPTGSLRITMLTIF